MEHPNDEEDGEETDPLMNSLAMLSQRQEARERDATQTDQYEQEQIEKERLYEAKQKSEAVETTIRVSNLSKSITENELRELFSKYGKVGKISLPRVINSVTNLKEPRGFAYISFEQRYHAENAMVALDGRGYDYLILSLEWAKPPAGGGGMGSGLSSGFVSGYGQKLAQDTTEKAMFTSHGNTGY